MNLLNVTIREVRQDTISMLPYAKQDVFAFVCYFSQAQSKNEDDKMKKFTQQVVQDVIALKGSFYLPYRLDYTHTQLQQAYPDFKAWSELKKKFDPHLLFDNQLFGYIVPEK